MTLQEKVRTFVQARSPRAICDDCIADYLALSRRQVSAMQPKLQKKGLLSRYRGQCSGCCTRRALSVSVVHATDQVIG